MKPQQPLQPQQPPSPQPQPAYPDQQPYFAPTSIPNHPPYPQQLAPMPPPAVPRPKTNTALKVTLITLSSVLVLAVVCIVAFSLLSKVTTPDQPSQPAANNNTGANETTTDGTLFEDPNKYSAKSYAPGQAQGLTIWQSQESAASSDNISVSMPGSWQQDSAFIQDNWGDDGLGLKYKTNDTWLAIWRGSTMQFDNNFHLTGSISFDDMKNNFTDELQSKGAYHDYATTQLNGQTWGIVVGKAGDYTIGVNNKPMKNTRLLIYFATLSNSYSYIEARLYTDMTSSKNDEKAILQSIQYMFSTIKYNTTSS
ncbi:hypothetical protein FWF48_00255 [Candidatus Saccharibacteria bacterium]|nr:hypothetical protein [Candidatus Saccharibacteria bacterium]